MLGLHARLERTTGAERKPTASQRLQVSTWQRDATVLAISYEDNG
jgi:hypothetical protein